ncbi:hypothetical protein BASA60_006578 [Batrachochytrium salamandrivorans]|nr:hypothetical protein BASA60_006578 [Batrachochytrium salamandrivorans]KAH6573103.1 hypothetical protein BASA62_003137 [Batrachochytrium salamandrivorans]
MRTPSITLLSDIRPGDTQLTIKVAVLETLVQLTGTVSLNAGDCTISVSEVVVGDASAVAIMEFINGWFDAIFNYQMVQVKEAGVVVFSNVSARLSHGFIRLTSDPFHMQAELDDNSSSKPPINYSLNISSTEYEPIMAALLE